MQTFELWEEGSITDIEALRAIWKDLREVDDQIAGLEAERQKLRDHVSQIVARTGPITLPGLGNAQITPPMVIASYDREKLDQLVAAIAAHYPDVARQISDCRKEQQRSGGLRLMNEKTPRGS